MSTRALVLMLAVGLLLMVACGGEEEEAVDPHKPIGELVAPGGTFRFSGTTAQVFNTRNALMWGGVAMPGVMQLDIYGEDVAFNPRGQKVSTGRPMITMTIPCGPDGDFYAGRTIVPASFSLFVGGMDVYPPAPYLPYGRVRLLDNPMSTVNVRYEVHIAFAKTAGTYTADVSGTVDMAGDQLREGRTAAYPVLEMPGELEFHVADTVFTPEFIVAVEEELDLMHQLVIFAFLEPCDVADPRKAEQTYFSFSIPCDLMDGEPVPCGVTTYIDQPGEDLTRVSAHAYGWTSMEIVLDDSTGLETLEGQLLFQNNGSQEAVSYFGGGPFRLQAKEIITSS